jgi:hypothetical protein
MRNGEGGTVPSYNLQVVTDTKYGLVVNVEATTDAIDYRQLDAALERCEQKNRKMQIIADGDYTKASEIDAQGRRAVFVSTAFPIRCRAGLLYLPCGRNGSSRRGAERGTRCAHARLSRTERSLSRLFPAKSMCSAKRAVSVEAVGHAHRRTSGDHDFQGQDENGRSTADLRATFVGCRVRACLGERTLRLEAVPLSRPAESHDGSHLGLPQLQPDALVAACNAHCKPSAQRLPRKGSDGNVRKHGNAASQILTAEVAKKSSRARTKNTISSHVPVPDL